MNLWPVFICWCLMLTSQSSLMIRPSTWTSTNTGPSIPTTTGEHKHFSAHKSIVFFLFWTESIFQINHPDTKLKDRSSAYVLMIGLCWKTSQSCRQSNDAIYSLTITGHSTVQRWQGETLKVNSILNVKMNIKKKIRTQTAENFIVYSSAWNANNTF